MHVLKVSKDLGFHVPNDFEIIGFDDLKMNQFISPMLSSIHQDIHGMAQKALESLIQIINDAKAKIPNHQTLPLKLIERESTKKAVN